MYLRAVRLKGFKSFPKQTELLFEPGVAVVIGPNGSGKSNLSEAVMWVLGEQSPTSVRGSSMQDVIFAGSIGRTDFPDGDHRQLIFGIRSKLFTLPDETILLCGHGAATTVGEEKRNNPFAGLGVRV